MLVLALVLVLVLGASANAQTDYIEQARRDVEARLGVSLQGEPFEVLVPATDTEFVKRHVELAGVPPYDWVLAVAIPQRNVLLVRGSRINTGANFAGPTLRHEIGHLVLAKVAKHAVERLPQWLEEGLCELAAGQAISRNEELELGAAARFGSLETLDELSARFPPHAPQAQRAYLVSRAFVKFLDERAQPEGAKGIIYLIERRETVADAIAHATGMTPREAETEWRRELAAKHSIGEALFYSPEAWGSLFGVLGVLAYVAWRIRVRIEKKLDARDGGHRRTA